MTSFAKFLVYGDPGAKSVIAKLIIESNYDTLVYSFVELVATVLF
jgi:hypothetical protein